MTGAAGARRLLAFVSSANRLSMPVLARALLASAMTTLALPTMARAEFRGKGSIVGRILSESVPEAEASATASAKPEEGKIISREALNALMKRPTEPVYDPLRPMSGRWVRCQSATTMSTSVCEKPSCKAANEAPAVQSRQDRYSSWDRSHFTHTVSFASDKDCKTVVSQERTNYECASVDKTALSCKAMKRETKVGGAAWTSVKVAGDEKPVALSFLGIGKKKKSVKPRDPRKLEARIGGETVSLVFEPSPPRLHKTND